MEIFSILEKVSDPRRDHLKKYSLESIFYITISAVLCGAESWNEVAEFGRAREDFFRERIKTSKEFHLMIHLTDCFHCWIPKN